ncbi:MAG: endonuclease/exonuclease/phosphatase family protein [Myxococcota bacterium]
MNALAVVVAVLTYNVHGLDRLVVDDDPEARMPAISARLNRYDVALLQESWTYYGALARLASHPVRERGNGPDPGTFFQSGLASFARPAFLAVSRGSLGACSGWIGGANDCLADKGYLRLRLRLANGVALDFWNLHLDAGDSDDDRAARAAQLQSLEKRVGELSGSGPLVVAGDFNLAEDSAADRALLERFRAVLALADSGARPARDGRFGEKNIDYILYREGAGVSLTPLEVGEAREFSAAEAPLSDHPALFARLRVTPPSGP